MAQSSRSLAPGELIGNKYSIVKPIGSGGMGIVYEALHTRLGQRVAVKMLLPDLAESEEAVARFEREARAAAHLRSSHVARVFDVDTLPDGTPYIVMELLHGRDLADELLDRGPLPIREAVDYVLQACDAMAEAHRLGIVHRDLKPGNLFLADDGQQSIVKVLDFGISKVGEAVAPSVTTTRTGLGTAVYMSPEQVRSAKNVDARSDVWALGVVLYELLTGGSPFEGDTSTAVAAAIVADPAEPLRSVRDDVPPELEAVVMKALEKDRERRFADAEALAAALAPFGSPRAQRPARPPDRTARTSPRSAPTRPERERNEDVTVRDEVTIVAPEEDESTRTTSAPLVVAPVEGLTEMSSKDTAKQAGPGARVTEVAGSPNEPDPATNGEPAPPIAERAEVVEPAEDIPMADEAGPPPILITAKPPKTPGPSVVPVTASTPVRRRSAWTQPRSVAVLVAIASAAIVSAVLVRELSQDPPAPAAIATRTVAEPLVPAASAPVPLPIPTTAPSISASATPAPPPTPEKSVAPKPRKPPKPSTHEKTGLPSDPG